MEKKEVVQILALLQTAFPNTRIDSDATFKLWYSLYKDVDFEVAKKATEFVIRTNDFFPTHKEFGKAITACSAEINNRPPAISEYSNETIERKIQAIIEMWETGELDI